MRVLAAIVVILGLAGLVFGILFIPKASSAEQAVADSIAPNLTLDQVNVTYDNLDQQLRAMTGAEPQYLQVFAQRTSMGLAKSNIGTAGLVRQLGIINIIVGLGLVITGVVLYRKSAA